NSGLALLVHNWPTARSDGPPIGNTGPFTGFRYGCAGLSRHTEGRVFDQETQMTMRRRIPAWGMIVAGLFPVAAMAQDSPELLARMKAMEDRIISLEAEVRSLKGQQPAAPVPAPAVAQTPAPEAAAAQAQTQATLGGAGG